MKKISLLAATVVLSTASVGIALADTNHGHGDNAPKAGTGMAMNGGGHDMMKMMQMHAGMMGGSGMGMMDQNVMGMMMGDGTASPEKMREQLQAMHSSFDADKDGTLSIEEFEMLHSSMIRNSMVDRFQHLDADGNGKVTAEEMTAPADRMKPGNMMHDGMKPGTMMGDTNMSNDGN